MAANCLSQSISEGDRATNHNRLPLVIVVALLVACGLAIASLFQPWGPPVNLLWFFWAIGPARFFLVLGSVIAFGVLAATAVIHCLWPSRVPRLMLLALAMVVGVGFIGLVSVRYISHLRAERILPEHWLGDEVLKDIGLGPYMMLDASVLTVVVASFQIWRDWRGRNTKQPRHAEPGVGADSR